MRSYRASLPCVIPAVPLSEPKACGFEAHMSLKTAVQMDPIEKIHIHGDSTFALLLEAQNRQHSIFYYTPDKLFMRDGCVFAEGHELRVHDNHGSHYDLGGKQTLALAEFDAVHLRQ